MTAFSGFGVSRSVLGRGLVALLFVVVLVAGPSVARADSGPPLLTINPIVVGNSTVTLTGTVGGNSLADAQLMVNGQQLPVNANSSFTGTVALGTASDLLLIQLTGANSELATIRIPLGLAVDGVIPANVLDTLANAGVSLVRPPDGFRLLDGAPLRIEGKVLAPDALASLTLNGREILSLLKRDGSSANFSQTISGSSRDVTITATDRRGVSQTSTFKITRVSTLIKTTAGASVSSSGAVGIKIAKIQYLIRNAKKTKHVGMIVTVKESRGFLVRDAIVRIRGKARTGFLTLNGQQAGLSNRLGIATFSIPVFEGSFGKRVLVVTFASTPTAHDALVTIFRLPVLFHAKRR